MRAALAAVVVLAVAGRAYADDARAEWRLAGGRPHAEVAFSLDLVVAGFDESPAPEQPKLAIPNAQVTPIGVSPNVSRSIQVINGRQSMSTNVTWVLRWRVLVPSAGPLHVPALTVKQGSKSATAEAAEGQVDTIPTTTEMKVELALPDRPVFVGETVPIKLVWLFRPQPDDQSFSVPMASLDTFTVSGPPAKPNTRTLKLAAGAKDLDLPFEVDTTTVGGVEYNRLTLTFYIAPRSIPPGGKVEIPGSSVVAALRVGRPDFFGNAGTKLFRAADVARSLEVKPLPESDRPPTFTGAVGEQFSIDVRTSRSVVSLGEPVELNVTVKSDQRLDTLSLGKLDGPGRLPKDKFTAPADSPTGELSEDGKTKTFKVVAQVIGPTTEIPALSFSYFDPKRQQYQTIHSEPIALSVKGSSIVGANDVVSGTRKPVKTGTVDDASLVDADLALSGGSLDEGLLGGALLWIIVALLYAIPLGVLGFRTWQLRTVHAREEASEVRAARRKVEELLDRATTAPAREIAGPLVAALRELARVLGRTVDDHGLLAKLETEAFAPAAAAQPLSPDLRSDAAGLLRRWTKEARVPRARAVAMIALLVLVPAAAAHADAPHDALADGRAAYQYAMEQTGDATARKAAFARAAAALGEAAHQHPDSPDLLADWGNAALGAGDVASATLAYRRALALDASNARARHNLAWLRGKLPELFQPRTSAGATDTLLFFHHWSRGGRLLASAIAFGAAMLLFVPWTGRRRSLLVALGVLPMLVWIAMLASLVLEDRRDNDAVVMDGVVLRAADSAGAPAALTQPLPRGVEVTIRERRDAWTRVELPNGTVGWLPDGAVEKIR